MEPEPTVLDSLRRAVEAMPDDVPLRLHLATLLLSSGLRDEAVRQLGAILQRDPGNETALGLLTAGVGPATPAEAAGQAPAGETGHSAERTVAHPPPTAPASPGGDAAGARPSAFDWSQAEDELRDVLPAMFVGEGESGGPGEPDAYDAEQAGLTLADVAGMTEVKQRLEAAFLAPMRNPDLRRLYGKSLRGGLLLYGPPGCGKTFIARAVAGELGAKFIAVSFADIIDMFVGQSERNIHELFEIARRNAPCVLFLDEVDAIGQKRSQLRNTPMRSAVNQLLLELDDISGNNEGVFLLAATNHPWDVDSALRRPGRFDRTLLVLPPDAAAREGVFRYHLKDRPVAGHRPGQAGPADRRVLRRRHRAHLRDGRRTGPDGLGPARRAADDRPARPRSRDRRGQAVAGRLVRHRPQRRAVRQRGRRLRRPGRLPPQTAAAVSRWP